jgi:hypothetical protein
MQQQLVLPHQDPALPWTPSMFSCHEFPLDVEWNPSTDRVILRVEPALGMVFGCLLHPLWWESHHARDNKVDFVLQLENVRKVHELSGSITLTIVDYSQQEIVAFHQWDQKCGCSHLHILRQDLADTFEQSIRHLCPEIHNGDHPSVNIAGNRYPLPMKLIPIEHGMILPTV